MKISDLIDEFYELKKVHGDIELVNQEHAPLRLHGVQAWARNWIDLPDNRAHEAIAITPVFNL